MCMTGDFISQKRPSESLGLKLLVVVYYQVGDESELWLLCKSTNYP